MTESAEDSKSTEESTDDKEFFKETGDKTTEDESKDDKTVDEVKETSTDEKPVDEKPKDDEPVEYDLALPKDSLMEPSVVDDIKTFAKENGLSNEAAQELIDSRSEAIAKYSEGQEERANETVEEIRKDWVEEAKADKEIGGEKYKETQELSMRVVERFGDDELKDILEKTGFGDNKAFIKIMSKIGSAMSEDELVIPGSQVSGGERTQAEVLFGEGTEV